MPAYGSMSPAPRRMGGGGSRVKTIFNSLASVRGSSFAATDSTKLVYLELLAIARAIAAAWGTNQRLASLWDAKRIPSGMLARWEAIFALSPTPTDDEPTRRARIGTLQANVGRASVLSAIQQPIMDALGAVFVSFDSISYANAVIHVPDGTYPWGTVVPDAPWSSTTAHILIRVTKPTGFSESAFYAAVAKIGPLLDASAPAYVTWDWYRAPEVGAPVAVTGGPSAGGFYLDERNLDNSAFDA